jgi:hypothetical protein
MGEGVGPCPAHSFMHPPPFTHPRPCLLTFAAVARICWGGTAVVVAAAVSLFVLTSPPSPHLPALAFVLLFPSLFGLRSCLLVCVLIPIHLCPLSCLPVQPPCGLHSHLFVPTHPTYLCLFPSRLAFVHARSFVCCPVHLCQPSHSCSCSCLRLGFVRTHLCPLTPLICACSCLRLAFICARLHLLV